MSDRPALLLIGHGSRSDAGVAQFLRFAEALRARAPGVEVGHGLIEFAVPDLDGAVDELVERGVREVVAVPLVLLGAGHLKDDGPAALARARRRHPGVAFSYARDLGLHPFVLAVAEDRAREALGALPDGRGDGRAVVLVGRGSTDPDANGDLCKAARLLADHRRLTGRDELDEVLPAFVSLARPSLPEALDRAERLGASAVAVVPYFLFTGVLPERVAAQAHAWADARPGRHVTVADVLGVDARLVDLALERYREAVAGGAHMNCDGCVHRVPIPGFEHKLGVPPSGLP